MVETEGQHSPFCWLGCKDKHIQLQHGAVDPFDKEKF